MLHAQNTISLKITAATKLAAKYLHDDQLPSGGFASWSLPTKYAKQSDIQYQTVFFPSLILSALHAVDLANLEQLKEKIAQFLISQKSSQWSFNYWDRNTDLHKIKPYPDDLDDTFCALAALMLIKPEVFTPTALAATAKLLIATEIGEGGPYKTWLTTSPKREWQDVDVAVNANVGYFLSLQNVELPSINEFIDAAIYTNQLKSPYYPNAYPIDYFIARWYTGLHRKVLIDKIWSRRRGAGWGHPQRTAMAITSLLCLGFSAQRLADAVEYLLHLQQANGSWEAEAFCVDPSVGGKTHYGSSPALCTALCIEALTRYQNAVNSEQVRAIQSTVQDEFQASVLSQVDARISELQQPEIEVGLQFIKQQITSQEENFQIIKLPLLISAAAGLKVDDNVLTQLALISFWGWMAYSTYDDFLDGEGDPALLPAANVCLRNLTRLLGLTLPTNTAFQNEVVRIMDRLDAANAWEMHHCRATVSGSVMHLLQIPDYANYWQLADRSLGHTIAGLGVLYASGEKSDSPRTDAVRTFFYHYLIARQLNDDAHDWFEDLQMGHINAVAAKILAVHYPRIPKNGVEIDLQNEKSVWQTYLWKELMSNICTDIQTQIELARRAIPAHGSGLDEAMFESLLVPIEKAINTAMLKRNEAIEFIEALKKKTRQTDL